MCRVAFSGAKELNRIQTVVYERAYRDTENLLICAPTGAGKTNIAMLTVLRVIKDNTEHGVIKKNDFKVFSILCGSLTVLKSPQLQLPTFR